MNVLIDDKPEDHKVKKVEALLKKLIENEIDMDTLAKLKDKRILHRKKPNEE